MYSGYYNNHDHMYIYDFYYITPRQSNKEITKYT